MTHIHPPTSRPTVTRRVPPFLLAFLAAVVATSGAAYAASGSVHTTGTGSQVNNFLTNPCTGQDEVGTESTARTYTGDVDPAVLFPGTVTVDDLTFTPVTGEAHVDTVPGFTWYESGGFGGETVNGTVGTTLPVDCDTIVWIDGGFLTEIVAEGTTVTDVGTEPATLACTSDTTGDYRREGVSGGDNIDFRFVDAATCMIIAVTEDATETGVTITYDLFDDSFGLTTGTISFS